MKELSERYKAEIVKGIPETDLVLYCPGLHGLGGKLLDRSQSANHGTISAATWTRLPRGIYVLSFNGTSSKVTTAAKGGLAGGTVEAWVRAGAGLGARAILIDDGVGSLVLGVQPTNYWGFSAFDTITDWCKSSLTITLNRWYHLVGTYETGAKRLLYVNGILDSTSLVNFTTLLATTGAQVMGKWAANYLNGIIGIPRIYKNRVLSATEILRHYTRERHLFGV